MTRWLSTLLLLLPALSCSSSTNSLSGSLSQAYDLSFDNVIIILQGPSVEVQYLKTDGSGWELVVNTSQIADVSGSTINLMNPLPNGQATGVLSYIGTVTTEFTLQRGTIVFDEVPKVGTTLSGNFATTTTNGQTLNGNFSANVSAL